MANPACAKLRSKDRAFLNPLCSMKANDVQSVKLHRLSFRSRNRASLRSLMAEML